MKNGVKRMRAVCLAVIILTSLSLPVSARESKQISSHGVSATPLDDGRIAIYFSVNSPGIMAELGASSILVYRKIMGNWILRDAFSASDSGMVRTNASFQAGTKYVTAVSGAEYKVVVTIFATDTKGGSDSRTRMVYLTMP